MIVRLHHNYSQLHGDHPDVEEEQTFQYHFRKNSYQYGIDFEKSQPPLQIWAFLDVELNEQPSDQR